MIDSHSHIYMDAYNEDRDQVLVRAKEAGITQLLQVGCNLEESRTVVALAAANPGIYASVGVHPHDASSYSNEVLAALTELTTDRKVLSWGEIGLDFFYDNSPRPVQLEAFAAQLKQARALDLPVVIHTREAEPETLEILSGQPLGRGGHVHCFTSSPTMANQLVDMGYHIGFTGIITFKRSQELREVVAAVPLERILIETDSPYLAPVPKRGKRNEPAFVGYVAACIAEVKGLTNEEVIAQTSANFHQLYAPPDFPWETL